MGCLTNMLCLDIRILKLEKCLKELKKYIRLCQMKKKTLLVVCAVNHHVIGLSWDNI